MRLSRLDLSELSGERVFPSRVPFADEANIYSPGARRSTMRGLHCVAGAPVSGTANSNDQVAIETLSSKVYASKDAFPQECRRQYYKDILCGPATSTSLLSQGYDAPKELLDFIESNPDAIKIYIQKHADKAEWEKLKIVFSPNTIAEELLKIFLFRPDQRQRALAALDSLFDAISIPNLLEENYGVPNVLERAVYASTYMAGELDTDVRLRACSLLGEAIERSKSDSLRFAAACAITHVCYGSREGTSQIDQRVPTQLINQLNSSDRSTRLCAVEHLSLLSDRKSNEQTLVTILRDLDNLDNKYEIEGAIISIQKIASRGNPIPDSAFDQPMIVLMKELDNLKVGDPTLTTIERIADLNNAATITAFDKLIGLLGRDDVKRVDATRYHLLVASPAVRIIGKIAKSLSPEQQQTAITSLQELNRQLPDAPLNFDVGQAELDIATTLEALAIEK